MTCASQCKVDQTCLTTCLGTAANQAAIDIAQCAILSSCISAGAELTIALTKLETVTMCALQNCPSQFGACSNDANCPFSLLNCVNKVLPKTFNAANTDFSLKTVSPSSTCALLFSGTTKLSLIKLT
jgi:hypothetical protein